MCFHYACIYTSKHSSQHSGRQEFIVLVTVLVTLLPLSDIMSKHVCLAARATRVCFPMSLPICMEK